MSNITSRSEQQQRTVRQLEEESRDDNLWDIFMENLSNLASQLSSRSSKSSSSSSSSSLQDFISSSNYNYRNNSSNSISTSITTTSIIHHNHRQQFCEDLIQAMTTNRIIILGVKDLQFLSECISKCSGSIRSSGVVIVKLKELMKYIETCYELQSCIDMMLQKLNILALSSSATTTTTSNNNNNNDKNKIDQNEYNILLNEINNIFSSSYLSNISDDYNHQINQLKEYRNIIENKINDINMKEKYNILINNKEKQQEILKSYFNEQLNINFPYLQLNVKYNQWLDNKRKLLEDESSSSILSSSLQDELSIILHSLTYQSIITMVSASSFTTTTTTMKDGYDDDNGINMNMDSHFQLQPSSSTSSSSSSIPLSIIDRIIFSVEKILINSTKENNNNNTSYLKIFISIIDCIIYEIKYKIKLQHEILMYTIIIYNIFLYLLNYNFDLYKQSIKIFKIILTCQSIFLIPNFINFDILMLTVNNNSLDSEIRIIVLYAGLISLSTHDNNINNDNSSNNSREQFKSVSPLNISDGWIWLYRAIMQLHTLISYAQSNIGSNSNHGSIDKDSQLNNAVTHIESRIIIVCQILRSFVKIAGNNLLLFYQDKFMDMIKSLQSLLLTTSTSNNGSSSNAIMRKVISSKDWNDLFLMINNIIDVKFIAPMYYKNQSPCMLDAAALIR